MRVKISSPGSFNVHGAECISDKLQEFNWLPFFLQWTGGVQASIADELLEQQSIVRQCIEQFEGFEISHALLCTYLKDFLLEQVISTLNS